MSELERTHESLPIRSQSSQSTINLVSIAVPNPNVPVDSTRLTL